MVLQNKAHHHHWPTFWTSFFPLMMCFFFSTTLHSIPTTLVLYCVTCISLHMSKCIYCSLLNSQVIPLCHLVHVAFIVVWFKIPNTSLLLCSIPYCQATRPHHTSLDQTRPDQAAEHLSTPPLEKTNCGSRSHLSAPPSSHCIFPFSFFYFSFPKSSYRPFLV